MRRRSALLLYFLAAFGIAWAGVLLAATRSGFPAPRGVPEANRYLVFLAMLAGPTFASLGLTVLVAGISGLRELMARLGRWRVSARWYASLLIAPGLLALTLGALTLVSPAYAPPILRGAPLGPVIAFAVVAGLGAGLLEELGWTGFATPRLLERYRWPRAGLLLGVVWAAWHGLADYWGSAAYGSLWGLHFLEWVVALAAFRMLMTWVYARTGSLLLGVLLHSSFTGGQALLWPAVGPAEELVWYGLFAFGLWIAVAGVGLGARRVASCRASREESMRPMPGDALVPGSTYTVTHAITVDAPLERVWPWLAQMGAGRAGWYSWDRIDNGGQRSASRILPGHQRLVPGDLLPAVPGAKNAFVVASVEPPRDLVLTVPGEGAAAVSWEHLLEPLDGGRARLIVRGRLSPGWKELARHAGAPGRDPIFVERVYRLLGRMPGRLLYFLAGAGHRVMEARHLRGIKRRAEAAEAAPPAAAGPGPRGREGVGRRTPPPAA